MAYIYRVENDKGLGIYTGCIGSEEAVLEKFLGEDFGKISSKHPKPEHDTGIERLMHDNEICGFESLEQAMQWFSEYELKIFRMIKFYLKKIKVKK